MARALPCDPPGRRAPVVSLGLAALAVVVALVPGLTTALQFDRLAIAQHEVWRLVTGHWTHASLEHLGWDTLAFLVLAPLCERRSRRRFGVAVFASALAISGAVWWVHPELAYYRGLSGLDSALFVLLAVTWLRESVGRRGGAGVATAVTLLALFAAKVIVEFATGATFFVSHAELVPVPWAHAVGGAVGGLVGAVRPRSESVPAGTPPLAPRHPLRYAGTSSQNTV